MPEIKRKVTIQIETVMVGNREMIDPDTVKVLIDNKPSDPSSLAQGWSSVQLESIELNVDREQRRRRSCGPLRASLRVTTENPKNYDPAEEESIVLVDVSSGGLSIHDVRNMIK